MSRSKIGLFLGLVLGSQTLWVGAEAFGINRAPAVVDGDRTSPSDPTNPGDPEGPPSVPSRLPGQRKFRTCRYVVNVNGADRILGAGEVIESRFAESYEGKVCLGQVSCSAQDVDAKAPAIDMRFSVSCASTQAGICPKAADCANASAPQRAARGTESRRRTAPPASGR